MQPDRYGSIPASQSRAIDQGLRSHMSSIYNRMTLGLFITAVVAFGMSSSAQLMQVVFGTPLKYLVIFGPLAIVWFGFNPARMSANAMRLSFIGLSVLYGMSFATIFYMFQMVDIAKAFFVTAGAFAGLSLFGYTTRKNLDGLGTFCVMGMIGLFMVMMVNLVWGMFSAETAPLNGASPMVMNLISVVTLLIFAGMTAFQTQQMKEMYRPSTGTEVNSRLAWSAALSLYLNFIMMFQAILHLMSNRN